MLCRDAGLPRLRDERVARLYSKSLLLRILFLILNDFWISNDVFEFINPFCVRKIYLMKTVFWYRFFVSGVFVISHVIKGASSDALFSSFREGVFDLLLFFNGLN